MAERLTKPWQALNMSRDQAGELAAVSRKHGVAPATVTALRLYTFTASKAGRFDQSLQQVVERHGGLFSSSQVRRSFDALTELGWWRTVEHPGRGRAAVRRLACFDTVSRPDTTGPTVNLEPASEPQNTARSTAEHRAETPLSPRGHNAVTSGNAAFSEPSLKPTTAAEQNSSEAEPAQAVVVDDQNGEPASLSIVRETLTKGGWRALRDRGWQEQHAEVIAELDQQEQQQRRLAEHHAMVSKQTEQLSAVELVEMTAAEVSTERTALATVRAAKRYVAEQAGVRNRGAYETRMRQVAAAWLADRLQTHQHWRCWVQYAPLELVAEAIDRQALREQDISPALAAELDQRAAAGRQQNAVA